ncbi:YdeI family protein [Microbacteriaceae bacterium 4G12]
MSEDATGANPGQGAVVPPAVGDAAPRFYAADRQDWRNWLADNGATAAGVWLVYDRGPARAFGYDQIVEEALCFGWIDSKGRKLDDARTMLYLAPRKPRSAWSRLNKVRVERLVADGRMTDPGLAVIEAAKRSGTWTALDDVEDGLEPPDLAAALDADPRARQHWDAFPRSARRGILEWISHAKRPATRLTRVQLTVSEAAEGRRANEWRPKATP